MILLESGWSYSKCTFDFLDIQNNITELTEYIDDVIIMHAHISPM